MVINFKNYIFESVNKPNARIVMSFKCNRKCRGCCNQIAEFDHILAKIEEIKDYEKVFITGGEPMLYPDRLMEVINILRNNGNKKIYLYTAWPYPKKKFLEILKHLDGVNLTLHAALDRMLFYDNGYDKMKFPGKRMVLKVFGVKHLNIEGDWDAKTAKWLKDCPMPPREDLYVLTENCNNNLLEKVAESPIVDINKYNTSLSKTIDEKLFFLDKINTDLIVDFGCADGKILQAIRQRKPKISLIGYDVSDDMLNIAKTTLPGANFTNDWISVRSAAYNHDNPTLLLSSVIHEVYSYSDSKEVKKFWEEKVFGGMFKYIVIRDMIPSVELQRQDFLNFREDAKKINKRANKKYLNSFENVWGLIDNDYRTLLQWLLKYRYTDNWERELKENYLPLTLETLYKKIPSNYRILFKDNYIFEPLQKHVMNDFGIKLNHTTHTKMIIERVR
jgi:hypothetical protein